MARSQGTFSKKEKEKARLKKRQDKQDKKDERKNQSSRGQSLEEMFAYVDENGNITSTPVDVTKKHVINPEDIVIGIPKQDPSEAEAPGREGVVTFFNESKGYGFIKDLRSQDSVFVHIRGLVDPIKQNDKVEFEVEMTPKGASAINVKRIG
ncbi:cold shock CspA family protein [Larkinella arboricola]|uniref:Cold shock CspA family protein n=1 Tax=Larkinella arboricola TaxID=643671 RepID=A0A327WM91_LARAB|nr:cold shock domain-containing protein [Larkinella arboricola]RAJ93133.1 cold shock CspA family protein [Larkinella arboricola]